jgi:hypothetical protein
LFIFSVTNEAEKMNMASIFPMPTKILKRPIEVRNRLGELGLRRDKLIEVVEAMVAAKAECTDNDPPGARGWSAWRMGTRRLREELLTEPGWERDETDQISSVVNKDLGIRIAVSNTDDGTGLDEEGRFPQNRSKKGAATDRVIQMNQGSFMEILDESVREKIVTLKPTDKKSGPIITWYLCSYCEGDEYRAELSCPNGVDGGFSTGFDERIFIIDSGEGGGVRRRRVGDNGGGAGSSEFEISVKRKK